MAGRKTEIRQLIRAGALIGALAAFVVAGFSHLLLWLRTNEVYVSTGATQGTDLWSYYSMARAVWRSSNGITYTYPYSLYWPVPEVIFQLPITLLAWLGRLTGLPVAFEIGRIAGAAGAGAALGAIGALFPRGFWRRWFYIAAVMGGGMFHYAAIAIAIDTANLPGLTELHQYQPKAEGQLFWWLPVLVRNLRMPLECIYHAVVMGALAFLLYRRMWWALALGAIAWMCNPFSAVALHAAVIPWLAWGAIHEDDGPRRNYVLHLVCWLAVNVLALLYYGWFLNQWPLMQELSDLYRSSYQPPLNWWRLALMLLPYGVCLAATVLFPPLRRDIWGRSRWRLFAILAIVHIALMQQSAILGERSMQAYHYNRGYLHLGLVVVAWRVLIITLRRYRSLGVKDSRNAWWPKHFHTRKGHLASMAVVIIAVLSMIDQFLFGLNAINRRSAGSVIERDYVAMVKSLPTGPAPYIVLTESSTLPGSYITAYSPHISWDANETMIVPFWADRIRWIIEAMEGKHGGVAGLGIDYAIVYKSHDEWLNVLTAQGWKIVANAHYLLLMEAPAPHPGLNPKPPSSLSSSFL